MPQLTNKPQILVEESIAEQITTNDIGMRRELVKNSSQTCIRSSFDAKDQHSYAMSRKTSVKSSWFECGSNQIDVNREDCIFTCVSAFDAREKSQKKTMKIYSVVNVKKKDSLSKKSERIPKINVSLNKRAQNKMINALCSFQNEIKNQQREAKQNRQLQFQQKIRIDINLSHKQQTKATPIKQIKQPDFHYKHPLQGNQRALNGTYLSKMIAERALQPKNKPCANYL